MNKIKQMLIIIMSFLMTIYFSYSQINCPDDGTGWSSSYVSYNFGDYGPGGQVNTQTKTTGGVFQIKVNWNSFQNNSDFMPASALKKILETEAVRNIVPPYPGPFECDVYVYFTRECKVQVKLVMDLVRDAEVQCADPGVNFCQNFYSQTVNGVDHSFYNIYQSINCGYKCCARVYHCSRVYSAISGWVTSVALPTTVSITTCSGLSNYRDCLTNNFLPCQDGSCDGYY